MVLVVCYGPHHRQNIIRQAGRVTEDRTRKRRDDFFFLFFMMRCTCHHICDAGFPCTAAAQVMVDAAVAATRPELPPPLPAAVTPGGDNGAGCARPRPAGDRVGG